MKRFAGLMMVVFLFVAALPSYAQVTNCYDLSADDCAILTNSTLATATLTGLSVDFDIDVAVSGLALVASLGLDAPEDIAMNVAGTGDIDLSQGSPAFAFDMVVTNAATDESFNIGVSLVDNALYLSADDEAYAVELNAETLSELGLPTDFLANSPETFGDLMGYAEDTTAIDLSEQDFSASYITLARDEDNADGDAVFVLHFDVTGLLNSPEMTELFGQLGGLSDVVGDNEDAQMVFMLLPMLISMVQSEIGLTQAINADGYVTNFNTVFYLAVDLGMLFAPDAGLDPIEVSADANLVFGNFDQPDAIVAPEGATFLTPEQLQQLLATIAP